MLFSDVPNDAQVIFIAGNEGVGKSVFINCLLGHTFKLEQGFDIVDVAHKTKPYAEIHHNVTALPPEQFSIAIFQLDAMTYLCELPPRFVDDDQQLQELETFTTENKDRCRLIVMGSADEFRSLCSQVFGGYWLEHFFFVMDACFDNPLFVMNNQGDAQFNIEFYTTLVPKIIASYQSTQQEIQAIIDRTKDAAKKANPTSIGLFAPKPELNQEIAPLEAQILWLESMRTSVYSKITPDNTLIWTSHDDPISKEQLFEKLAMARHAMGSSQI